MRLDVPTTYVEAERLREAGVRYFMETDNEDFEMKLSDEYRELSKSIFGQ